MPIPTPPPPSDSVEFTHSRLQAGANIVALTFRFYLTPSVEHGSSSLLSIAPTLVLINLVPPKSSRQRFPRYPIASFSPHPVAPVRQRPDIRPCSHAFALSARRDSKARGLISRMLHRTTDYSASGGALALGLTTMHRLAMHLHA